MRSSVISATCAVILVLSCAGQNEPALIASAKDVTTKEQLHEWLTYYYLHPRPDLTISAIHLMSKEGWLSKASSHSPLAAFLAQVFALNGSMIKPWLTELEAGTEDQETMGALALWMAHTDNTQELLKSMATKGSPTHQVYVKGLLADNRPPDFLNDAIASPSFIDALWGSFFATGDERFVQRIIGTLSLLKSQGNTQDVLIGGAAKWSLTSNAIQHPRVLEICEAELAKSAGDQKPILAEVIANARKEKH
jgi:hypothetical protein